MGKLQINGDLLLAAGDEDRFLTFNYTGGTGYDWRIGYLGSGSGNENFLVFQSDKEGSTFYNALKFGLTTLNAEFGGTVTASSFIGNLSGTANYAYYLNTVAGNEIRIHNATGLTAGGSLWLGWAWADGNTTVTKDWYIGNFSGGGLANIYASTFNGSLNGNATSASSVAWSGVTGKPSTFTPSSHSHNTLDNISATDEASYSSTQRYIFMAYNDLSTNRPAYDTRLTFQTSTGTLSAPIFKGSLSGNATSATSADWASGASYAERVAGYYTGNGGAQGPSYIGRGNVKFNMMNQFPNAGTTNYMDCILMNTYGGGDVPRATAFGIERYTGRAWIAEGSDTSSTWAQVYEVISTRNIASQSVNYANTAGWASSAGDAGTLNGWYASGFIRKHGWWTNGNTSYHADTTEDGIVFAYTCHGVPSTWGTLCTFGYGNGQDYNLQLHGTGNNQLFFRNRSSDYGQGSWQQVQVVTGWGSTNPNSAGIRGTNTGDVYYVY